MSISDKTRKMLWGRSGNRCAICRHELVLGRTAKDDDSVIAEECHIASSQPNGPRFDSSIATGKIDVYENLILLCRIHHKMVDDQAETYTIEVLRDIKQNHVGWVAEKLTDEQKSEPVRIRRVTENIPPILSRITTGKEVLNVVNDAMAFVHDHDELKTQQEVDLVGRFFEIAQDWGDFSDELEAGARVQASFDLAEALREVEGAGFFVFGGREVRRLEGGQAPPRNWPISVLKVLRNDNPEIMRIDLTDVAQKNPSKKG